MEQIYLFAIFTGVSNGDLFGAVNRAASRIADLDDLLVCRWSPDRPAGGATPPLLLSSEGFGVICNRESSGLKGVPSGVDPESDIVRLRCRAGHLGAGHATHFHQVDLLVIRCGSVGRHSYRIHARRQRGILFLS